MNELADEFVTIARVIKTQGRRGEVSATLFTDFPERFASRKRLFAWGEDGGRGTRRELLLEEHWFHKKQVVLKFAGVDSISQAETLIGSEIQVPRGERPRLEGDAVYVSDLAGCEVYDHGKKIGAIRDVRFGSGEAPLLVIQGGMTQDGVAEDGVTQGGKEHLVPFVAAYIEKIALEQKRVEMKLPEGMLELDAPLTREEKLLHNNREQKQAD